MSARRPKKSSQLNRRKVEDSPLDLIASLSTEMRVLKEERGLLRQDASQVNEAVKSFTSTVDSLSKLINRLSHLHVGAWQAQFTLILQETFNQHGISGSFFKNVADQSAKTFCEFLRRQEPQ